MKSHCLERIGEAVEELYRWIRNSVDDAIRIYRQLQLKTGRRHGKPLLFHSRFAFTIVSGLSRRR